MKLFLNHNLIASPSPTPITNDDEQEILMNISRFKPLMQLNIITCGAPLSLPLVKHEVP